MRKLVLIGLLLAAFAMFGCNTPMDIEDLTPPTIGSTGPADAAVAVERNASVTATFDEDMDSATITDLTFTLAQGVTPVAGVVSYAAKVATFNPNADLAASTKYTATVTLGANTIH